MYDFFFLCNFKGSKEGISSLEKNKKMKWKNKEWMNEGMKEWRNELELLKYWNERMKKHPMPAGLIYSDREKYLELE